MRDPSGYRTLRARPRAMVVFVFAAGFGTRLRPLTDRVPKALVEVGGRPLLEHVLRRCRAAGATRIVVNVAHLGDQVEAWLRAHDLGVPVAVSREPDGPLETGGGLRRAAPLLPPDEPVLLHNADVLTNVDLAALLAAHRASGAWATLAVAPPASDRTLTFDEAGLAGYALGSVERLVRATVGATARFDFCGVHAVAPQLVRRTAAEPAERFSIMDLYLRLAREGVPIRPFGGDGHRCLDVGTPERLVEAEAWLGAAT